MASQDPGAYNLMCGKVFLAMLTCPVMTISRRAEDTEIKTNIFRDAAMCPVVTISRRAEDFKSEANIDYSTFDRAIPRGQAKNIQRIGCQPEKNYFTRWPIPLVVC